MKIEYRIKAFNTCGCELTGLVFDKDVKIRKSNNVFQCVDLTNLPHNKNSINWKETKDTDVLFIYNEILDYLHIIECENGKNIKTKYKDDKIITTNSGTFTRPNLGSVIGKIHTNYIYDVGEIIKTSRNNMKVLDRSSSKRGDKKYYVECMTCDNKFWLNQQSIVKYKDGIFCDVCKGYIVKEGYNDIPTTDPWMIPYFQGGIKEAKQYTSTSTKKLYFKCPYCGKINDKLKTIFNLKQYEGFECICNNTWSYPERFTADILDQKDIDFIHEYKPKWAQKKRYDFYLIKYNIIIELDGMVGHGNYAKNKSPEQIKNEIEIDEWKTKVANEHGIEVYRVPYKFEKKDQFEIDFKETIPKFIWENTNFEKAREIAKEGRVLRACKEYEHSDKTKESIEKIAKQLHCKVSTLKNYLKIGNEQGWCKYS